MASKKSERKRIKAKAAAKSAARAGKAPTGSEYPMGGFGKGKVTDKGARTR